MYCSICDTEVSCIISRYQFEPFLDGNKHECLCLLCSTMAEKYFSSCSYGILTGNITDKDFVKSCGFSDEEIKNAEKLFKKLITPIKAKRIVLNSLPLGRLVLADLGVFVLIPDDNDSSNLIQVLPTQV